MPRKTKRQGYFTAEEEREMKKKSASNAALLTTVGMAVSLVTKDGGSARSTLSHYPSKLPSGWWVCGVEGHGAVLCEKVTVLETEGDKQ